MSLIVHLSATPLATETGIWCPHCLLPSAVKTTLALAFDCGSSAGSFTVTACEDCGQDEKPEL